MHYYRFLSSTNTTVLLGRLSTTIIPKPGHAPGFFTPAKGQQWRGFAGSAKFVDRRMVPISPCQPPEFLSFSVFV
jgi:hypothetical protein